MFLYGGSTGAGRYNDDTPELVNIIWELKWSERQWVRHTIQTGAIWGALSPRFGHSMVHDPHTGDLIVYGGFTTAPDWDAPAPRAATSNDMLLYNIATTTYEVIGQPEAPARAFHKVMFTGYSLDVHWRY
jgi:hypothetical protein